MAVRTHILCLVAVTSILTLISILSLAFKVKATTVYRDQTHNTLTFVDFIPDDPKGALLALYPQNLYETSKLLIASASLCLILSFLVTLFSFCSLRKGPLRVWSPMSRGAPKLTSPLDLISATCITDFSASGHLLARTRNFHAPLYNPRHIRPF